jgi:hypothetical protein
MENDQRRQQLLARLAAERAGLLEGLLGLDQPTLTEKLVYDDWSVKDILAHVAGWDRWEERTMRAMVAGEEPDFSVVQDFAVSNAAMLADWRDRSLEEVLTELMAARSDWVAFLASLSDEEFFLSRSYYGHDWTFSDVPMQIQWGHDAEHAKEIVGWRDAEGLGGGRGPIPVLLAALEAARAELLSASVLVPESERATRPICGEWTLKDVLGHVADWEWYAVKGLRQMADGQKPDPEPIVDIETWNVAHVKARRDQPWEAVWDDLHAARRAFLEVLNGMSEAELARSFPFAWGEEGSPYQWCAVFVGHDREHARDPRGPLEKLRK